MDLSLRLAYPSLYVGLMRRAFLGRWWCERGHGTPNLCQTEITVIRSFTSPNYDITDSDGFIIIRIRILDASLICAVGQCGNAVFHVANKSS